MILHFRLALGVLAFCLAAAPVTAKFSGVLYSDHGGASGAGTGEIRLAVAGQVRRFVYQKPYPQNFASPACRDAGALWNIVVEPGDFDGKLVSAECHESDHLSQAAIAVVKMLLNKLEAKTYRDAYDLFSSTWQGSHTFDQFVGHVGAFDEWRSYHMFGGDGRCLDIIKTSENLAVIRAGIECYIRKSGKPVAGLQFQVVNGAQGWKLADMEEVDWKVPE
jgi:hypothetical protein